MIVVSNSYSANVELAIEVATALYKVGVPLLIRDAEKLLRILREEDYVRLIPNTYHNYMDYQEEGTVYELPWEYECSDDSESDLTLEQYNAIVSLAEWQDEELVKPIE
jgi:phosphoenolpyruvate carboxylase